MSLASETCSGTRRRVTTFDRSRALRAPAAPVPVNPVWQARESPWPSLVARDRLVSLDFHQLNPREHIQGPELQAVPQTE